MVTTLAPNAGSGCGESRQSHVILAYAVTSNDLRCTDHNKNCITDHEDAHSFFFGLFHRRVRPETILHPSKMLFILPLAFLCILSSCFFLLPLVVGGFSAGSSFRTQQADALRSLVEEIRLGHSAAVQYGPMARTTQFVPEKTCSKDLIYFQKCTGSRVFGLEAFEEAQKTFDRDFDGDDVQANINRVSVLDTSRSTMDSAVVRVQWNVTWIPITSSWLDALPAECKEYVTYNHLSNKISTFSWTAVGSLLWNYLSTNTIRVPLSCICGISDLTFETNSSSQNSVFMLKSIEEDLEYSLDLNRGALLNRKCSDDLRLFLEAGRRLQSDKDAWYDTVATALPWSSVPGSNVLDVDETEEGGIAAGLFLGVSALSILTLAAFLAPELIGQSLWGPPNYIVEPGDSGILY